MTNEKKILLFGYGNPGRLDDGLGNKFVEEMEKWVTEKGIKNVEFDSNYQLNIEDSDTISDKDIVVFVDASQEDFVEDFYIDEIDPSNAKIEFTMHASSPAFIVNLCSEIYNKHPKAYLLHIKGYTWEFAEGLTDKANDNLQKALAFTQDVLENNKCFVN